MLVYQGVVSWRVSGGIFFRSRWCDVWIEKNHGTETNGPIVEVSRVNAWKKCLEPMVAFPVAEVESSFGGGNSNIFGIFIPIWGR